MTNNSAGTWFLAAKEGRKELRWKVMLCSRKSKRTPLDCQRPSRNTHGDTSYGRWGGKLFATASEGGCGVTLKSTLEKQAMLIQHPNISVASHVGRFGWVYVEASDEDTLALALDLMEECYQAVLPRRKRPQPA